jgi:hypothetical protein
VFLSQCVAFVSICLVTLLIRLVLRCHSVVSSGLGRTICEANGMGGTTDISASPRRRPRPTCVVFAAHRQKIYARSTCIYWWRSGSGQWTASQRISGAVQQDRRESVPRPSPGMIPFVLTLAHAPQRPRRLLVRSFRKSRPRFKNMTKDGMSSMVSPVGVAFDSLMCPFTQTRTQCI